jgi:WD40 repeat protein
MNTGRVIHQFEPPDGAQSVAFAPDGQTLVTGGIDAVLRLWDVLAGREILRISEQGALDYSSAIRCVAFAPGGKVVAAGGVDRLVRLWDATTGKEVRRLAGHQGEVNALAFAPDGKTLVTGSRDTTTLVWDVTPVVRGDR